ncbi:AzlC family protein [Neisseria gonorrhoeae]|nr:AzlC family protein [Neisseria gonorrhoeae]TJW29033.1 AzlC family protein [Neisseria gonorrhoeae]TJW89463.1 AzlC family protein [Neisseria gonorrhoeae]TJX21465.1 AzlC family protein [Neisseria gonorrhoeae]
MEIDGFSEIGGMKPTLQPAFYSGLTKTGTALPRPGSKGTVP